ncbi:DNA cytosine methyltransferase [Halomarina oriensis]|uniref:DNA (cytosine-5-)-methyltransferase n=1 Tax=Halomarina oriensis TaxID=671145 RepID=A0A6B0GP16_9EURY|nr:DNA cytosine methyltransferase [Halomarina oriensis]MWG36676.1 DNA (cytosine-5-)-methyltransferase [Halomarina oriensis]
MHEQLLLDNTEFLIDTLTAEHLRRQRLPPGGCPLATPAQLARNRSGDCDACRYDTVHGRTGKSSGEACHCGDPLIGSDDPLDTVAAVVLGSDGLTPAERFFDRPPRKTVASLRDQVGTWKEIAVMEHDALRTALEAATPRKGVSDERISRITKLLERVEETHYTDGVTLCGFSNVQYGTYVKFLLTIPGIDTDDAWWLVQTAFDKPVWPTDPDVDRLLCELGLLTPDALEDESGRRTDLEDKLIDRQVPALFRALSTHTVSSEDVLCSDTCDLRKFLLSYRLRQQETEHTGPTVVDLFAGAGGLSTGLSRAGYDIRWAIDIDPDAVATYRLNHPEIPHSNIVQGDVREIDLVNQIRDTVTDPDLVVGGPPCQSLSKAGYRSRRAKDDDYSVLDDERTTLYTQYVEVVDALRPKAIVMENVEGMINEVGDTGERVIDWVMNDLEALGANGSGYQVDFRLKDMTEFGVPQERSRVLLVGIRDDLVDTPDDVSTLLDGLPQADSVRSLQQGLAGLPRLRRGEGGRVLAERGLGSKSQFVTENGLHEGTDLCYNHQAREHPMAKDQILFDEALEPGETSWDVVFGSDGEYAEYVEYDVGTEDNPRFGDKYRKLVWSEPSPTIVAHLAKDANGYILPDFYEHARPSPEQADPERNRGITPREAARLQSFPDDYIFLGPFTSWFRQIGNAVPPLAGTVLGKALLPVMGIAATQELAPRDRTATGIVSDD